MSQQATPIFLLIEKSKVLPRVCMRNKDGSNLTDAELISMLVGTIRMIDNERLEMIGSIKQMETYILEKYGEIYDPFTDK